MADPQLQQGIQAAKDGNNTLARSLLVQVVQRDVDNEMAWIWMAQVMDEPAQKIDCLKQALRINPENQVVRKAIEALNQPTESPLSQLESVPQPEPEPELEWGQESVIEFEDVQDLGTELAPETAAEPGFSAEPGQTWDTSLVPEWGETSVEEPEPVVEDETPSADPSEDWLSALDDDAGSIWATESVESSEDQLPEQATALPGAEPVADAVSSADWLSALDDDAGSIWATEPAAETETAPSEQDEQSAAPDSEWLTMLDKDAAPEWESSSEAAPSPQDEGGSDWLSALEADDGAAWETESVAETEETPFTDAAFSADTDSAFASEPPSSADTESGSDWMTMLDEDAPPTWIAESAAELAAEPEPDSVAPSDWASMLDGGAAAGGVPEPASDAEQAWDFDQAWGGDPEAGEEAQVEPTLQTEVASDEEPTWDFDQVWSPDTDVSAPAVPDAASPFTVEPIADPVVEEEQEGLASWASDLEFDLGPDAQSAVSPFIEEPKPTESQSPVFDYDDDLGAGLTFEQEPEPEPEPEIAPPTGRVSLLDRNRMSRFSVPKPATTLPESSESVDYAEPVEAALPDETSMSDTTTMPVRQVRVAKPRKGFRVLDLRVVLGLLDIIAIPVIAGMMFLIYGGNFSNRASRLTQQVSGVCLDVDRAAFTPQPADTGIGGFLAGDMLFESEKTYYVTQTLIISESQRMLVEPGVKLVFSPETGLEVRGELYVCGIEEAGQQVLFTAEDKEPGGWLGIRFVDVADQVMLSYAEIQFAGERALYFENSAPVLANVTIANSALFPISLDGGTIPELSGGIVFRDNPFTGIEIRGGALPPGGVVWPALEWPYVLSGAVKVEADTTLDIQSGAVVKAWATLERPASLWVQGLLKADFVQFTSIHDSREEVFGQTYVESRAPSPGDWTGITFNESSEACALRNVDVRYAGRGRAAIFMRDSSPQLVNVTVADSAWHPLSVDATSLPTFESVNLSDNATGATMEIRNGSSITGRDVEQTWELLGDAESPIIRVIEGTFTIDSDAKLTLIPGVVVKFGSRGKLIVNGSLQASGGGAENNRIVLTSVYDADYGGSTYGLTYAQGEPHWGGVIFDPSGEDSMVQNTVIRYGTVRVNRGSPRLVTNRILDSVGAAIEMPPDATPELQNNIFEGNRINGIAILPGVMTRNQQWVRLGDTQTQMVRVLIGEVVVSEGVTLTIAPGTVIKADVAGRLVISGGLQAKGVATLDIGFTSLKDNEEAGMTGQNLDDAPLPSDWQGLVVGPNASVIANYTFVRYADVGLTLLGTSVPVVEEGILQISKGNRALRCSQAVQIPDAFQILDNVTNEKRCPAP